MALLSHFCSPLTPLMLAIPTTLILWLGHWWNGVDPILDLRNSFLINPIRWLHHSLFFIAGLGWHSGRTRLPALTRGPLPWLFLAGSAVALLVRVRWLPLDLAASLTGSAAWMSVASASLFGWLTLYGSLGVCAHLARYGGRAIKYLSDSSYWVYLAHFPVVGLVQADLFLVALPSHRQVPGRACDRPGLEPSHIRGLRSPHLDWPVAAWWRPPGRESGRNSN